MTQDHPLVERYITRLREGLSALTPADRDGIVSDIRSHLAEATAAGTPLDSVLRSLGPADELARAYALELLLNPPAGRTSSMSFPSRFFALMGLAMAMSMPTIIAVSVLGSVGLSFFAAGIAVLLAGILDVFGVVLPFLDDDMVRVHPVFAVMLGPLMSLVGAASLWALYHYLRWLARTFKRTRLSRA